MVNASSAHIQPVPAQASGHPATCPPDRDLPENSKENLDARLDLGVEETFPASDPVAVTITKRSTPEDRLQLALSTSGVQSQAHPDHAEQETAEERLDQVKGAVERVARTAYGTVRESYDKARGYARQARERYPEAGRSYRAGRRTVEEWMVEHPLPSLLIAGAIGYGLAWMIHSEPRGRERRIPDSARTRTRYAPRRN
jgi:hypothetical protein